MDYLVFTVIGRLDSALTALLIAVIAGIVVSVAAHYARRAVPILPLAEILFRPFAVFLVDRLNRTGRSFYALMIRGMIVFALLAFIILGFCFFVRAVTSPYHGDVVLLLLLLAPVLSVFAALGLASDTHAPRSYRYVAEALNRNLVKVDEAGHRRNGFDILALSYTEWMVAPIVFYLLGGIGGAYLYATLSLFCRVTGAAQGNSNFLSICAWLWRLLRFAPYTLSVVIIGLSAIFVPKGHPLAGLKSLTSGVLAVYAGAVGITLGGSYQDRHGQTVKQQWFGRRGTTARITRGDVMRGCYLHGIAVFIFAVILFALFAYL